MRQALRKVSTGFKLVYYGLVLVVLAVIIGILGAVVLVGAAAGGAAGGGAGGGRAVAGGAVGLFLLVGGMAIVGSIVGLIGRFHCLAIPEEAGSAKQMIVTSVVLEIIALLSSVVNTADNAGGNFIPAQVKMATGGLGVIFSIVAAILFLLFIRSAAEFVRRPRLAETAMSVLWLWVGAVGCYIAGIVVAVIGGVAAGAAGGGGGGAGGGAAVGGACIGVLLMLAALVIGLVALVKYARLLTEMSTATLRFANKASGYDDEEDEDDRPRRRSRRDEEDDEDEPPRRRSSRHDDDDDEEDRPRRPSRRDDDDEEDERPRRSKKRDDDW